MATKVIQYAQSKPSLSSFRGKHARSSIEYVAETRCWKREDYELDYSSSSILLLKFLQSKASSMAASSAKSRTSQGTTLHSQFHRSLSPNRFCSSSISRTSISNFVTRPAPVLARSTSPTRISLGRSSSPTVRFSTSNHCQHNQKSNSRPLSSAPKKTMCACSPTSHPGSFRCSLHKNSPAPGHINNRTVSCRSSNHQLNMRRSAMTNSLVRIGTVEGDLVKRALASLIRPSSHNQRRRENFQPRPSRLSAMSTTAENLE